MSRSAFKVITSSLLCNISNCTKTGLKSTCSFYRSYGSLPDRSVYGDMVLRHAILEDIPGIIQLSRDAHKHWYPSDYLPGWLPRSLTDPNRLNCVTEKQGHIVAFFQAARADDGDTILLEAGRCHPKIEGTGALGRSMAWTLSRMSRTLCPHWTSPRGSSIQTHYYDKHADKINLLAKRTYLRAILPSTSELRDRLTTLQSFTARTPLTRLSQHQFQDVLSDPALVSRLYLNNLISVGYNMYKPLPSNVPLITYFHDNVVVTSDFSDGISVGGRVPCNDDRGWRYNFNYSGRPDLETCMSHLVEHLDMCVQEPQDKDEVHFMILLPMSFVNMYGAKLLFITLEDLLGISTDRMQLFTQYQFEYAQL